MKLDRGGLFAREGARHAVRAGRPHCAGPSGCLAVLAAGGVRAKLASLKHARPLIRLKLRSLAAQRASPVPHRIPGLGVFDRRRRRHAPRLLRVTLLPCSRSTTTATRFITARSRCSAANSCRASRCLPVPTMCCRRCSSAGSVPSRNPLHSMTQRSRACTRSAISISCRAHGTSGSPSTRPTPRATRCLRTGRSAPSAPTCCPRASPRAWACSRTTPARR